MSLIEIAALT